VFAPTPRASRARLLQADSGAADNSSALSAAFDKPTDAAAVAAIGMPAADAFAALGTPVRRVSSLGDLRLDDGLLADAALQLDFSDDLDWLQSDDALTSGQSDDSMQQLDALTVRPREDPAAADLLLGAGLDDSASAAASPCNAGSSLHCDSFGDAGGGREAAQPPALRESKCRASSALPNVAASKQVPIRQLGTGQCSAATRPPPRMQPPAQNPQQQQQQQQQPQATPAGGHVRMMPVWMMPTAQHPQGRVVMMPVHFMPAGAAAPGAMVAKQPPLSRASSAIASLPGPNVREFFCQSLCCACRPVANCLSASAQHLDELFCALLVCNVLLRSCRRLTRSRCSCRAARAATRPARPASAAVRRRAPRRCPRPSAPLARPPRAAA
jgi:hypothetical protein